MDGNSNYLGLLLEEIRAQNQAVLEAVSDMQRHVRNIPRLEESIGRLSTEMRITTSVIADISRQQNNHGQRITILETYRAP